MKEFKEVRPLWPDGSLVRRMWINQPSKHQPLHNLHGTNVLACVETEDICCVYFLSGPVTWAIAPRLSLSDGWIQSDAPKDSAADGPVCDNCGDSDPDEDGNTAPNGEWLCESCYRELVGYCEDCLGYYWRDDVICGPDDVYRCEDCRRGRDELREQVVHATVRESIDEEWIDIECRFANGEKLVAVQVAADRPALADRIRELLAQQETREPTQAVREAPLVSDTAIRALNTAYDYFTRQYLEHMDAGRAELADIYNRRRVALGEVARALGGRSS